MGNRRVLVINKKNKGGRFDLEQEFFGLSMSYKGALGNIHLGPQVGFGLMFRGSVWFFNTNEAPEIILVAGGEMAHIGFAVNTYPNDFLTIEYSARGAMEIATSHRESDVGLLLTTSVNVGFFWGEKYQKGFRFSVGRSGNGFYIGTSILINRWSFFKKR